MSEITNAFPDRNKLFPGPSLEKRGELKESG